ncbi:peptidoglycan DD-metalloendopeptidase family protein [Priestia aryabhattai]|uniref:peptidoglycan DD-metalloendopeptidase family protein n=2 Tax=Priestia megaterium TaxID=1404 RepID=UPI0039B8C922
MRKSLIRNHNELLKYRQQIMNTEHDMYKLGPQMGKYTGTNKEFMDEIHKLGKEHKKATDQMINNNVAMRQSIIQQVATMSAMSGQSEKTAKNYDRMGNSLLRVNNPLLSVTSNLSRLARESSSASLALQMLGPNASMKELQDMIGMITQGVMRMQSVAMVTSVAWAGFTAILANAAKGPDVGENLAAQANAWADYRDAVKNRTQEIVDTWGLFEKVQLEKTSPQKLLSNLQGQVKVMQDWSKNLNSLASKGVDEGFIASLRKMGPEAASQIAALNQMSQPQLNKYVDLWRQKHQLARQAATTELEKLKQETQLKVKGLQDSLTPLGVSLYNFKNTWASAVAPFVAFWGTIAAKIVDVGTMIGGFINKLNEINPWITKLAGMFLYLVATFALILTPLAAGIGYIMGLKAAFAAAWVFIGPLVEGLAAMMGTVVIVSAAVIAFGAALYLLWTRSETFRNAVISGWTAIKNKALEVWGFLSPYINQALSAVVSFGQSKLAQLRSFWDSNGQQILQAAKNIFSGITTAVRVAMSIITPILSVVWPFLVGIIQGAWRNIMGIIDGALKIIMGLVKVFAGLFTGDFSKMWEGLKQIFFGAIQLIWNYINLMFVGRILGVFRGFGGLLRGIVTGLWGALKSLFLGGTKSVLSNIETFRIGLLYIFDFIKSKAIAIAQGLWNFLKSAFSAGASFIVSVVRGYFNLLLSVFNFLKSSATTIIKGLWTFLSNAFSSGGNLLLRLLKGAAQQIVNSFNVMKSSLSRVATALWTFLKNAFSAGGDFIVRLVKGAGSRLTSAWSVVKSSITNLAQSMWKNVTDRFTSIVKAAKDLPGKIGAGIKSMSKYALGGVKHLANTLVSGLASGINGVTDGIDWVLGKIGVNSNIPTWNPPEYATGTNYHPGGPAILGDGGMKELYITPSGHMGMSPATDTMLNLPRGTKVFSGPQTQELMASGMIPAYDSGNVGKNFKSVAADALGTLKDTAVDVGTAAKEKVTAGATKVKDLALDVYDYVSNPGDLMKKVFAKFIPDLPKISGAFGSMLSGSVKKIKSSAVDYVKNQLEAIDFMGGDASGTGIGSYYLGSPFRISTRFTPNGNKNDKVHKGGVHHGIDLAAPSGTAIKSLTDGIVKQVIIGSSTAGNGVRIQSGSDLLSYIHMLRAPSVKQGQHVKEGQVIGQVGSTGEALPLLTVMVSRTIL